jgi:hypothetical protein
MMVVSIDVTPWAVVASALGVLFGTWMSQRLYVIFAVLSAFFGAYSTAVLFGMPYNALTSVSWLLSVFFGTASIANLVATWIRRIEFELRTMREQLEFLRLTVEGR